MRWTEKEAADWYNKQPWLVGCNYIPASAINQLEMWQADTFNLKQIDKELGLAEGLGMNTARVFLHDLLWKQDSNGFKTRIEDFLVVADKHKIRPLFVLFDNCWQPTAALGKQPLPKPGVHNSGWVKSPSTNVLSNPEEYPRLEAYVKGVVGAFARDRRILGWDIWNEPPPSSEPWANASSNLLVAAFGWARSVNPTQPLTCCFWEGNWETDEGMSGLSRKYATLVDIISFHSYAGAGALEGRIQSLRRFHRPIICTEYMARSAGSTFESNLPVLRKHHVAGYNWGLVNGKTQTQFPWDSVDNPYTNREPAVWFHDIFHADGTPYREAEVTFIKATTVAENQRSPSTKESNP